MKKQHIKGILIDPVNRTITETMIPCADGNVTLQGMYDALECEMVEAVRFPKTAHTLWVDEEGLFKRGNPAFSYQGVGQGMFVGRALVLGDTKGGNCTDSKLTVADVTAFVAWTNKVAAL
jgi:hypothetical protein